MIFESSSPKKDECGTGMLGDSRQGLLKDLGLDAEPPQYLYGRFAFHTGLQLLLCISRIRRLILRSIPMVLMPKNERKRSISEHQAFHSFVDASPSFERPFATDAPFEIAWGLPGDCPLLDNSLPNALVPFLDTNSFTTQYHLVPTSCSLQAKCAYASPINTFSRINNPSALRSSCPLISTPSNERTDTHLVQHPSPAPPTLAHAHNAPHSRGSADTPPIARARYWSRRHIPRSAHLDLDSEGPDQ